MQLLFSRSADRRRTVRLTAAGNKQPETQPAQPNVKAFPPFLVLLSSEYRHRHEKRSLYSHVLNTTVPAVAETLLAPPSSFASPAVRDAETWTQILDLSSAGPPPFVVESDLRTFV